MAYQRQPLTVGRVLGGLVCPGGYRASQFSAPAVNRPTKAAAGMSYTHARSQRMRPRRLPPAANPDGSTRDSLALMVRGTLSKVRGLGWSTERAACPCCGSRQKGKLVLNERGRVRLAAARRRAEERGKAGERATAEFLKARGFVEDFNVYCLSDPSGWRVWASTCDGDLRIDEHDFCFGLYPPPADCIEDATLVLSSDDPEPLDFGTAFARMMEAFRDAIASNPTQEN